MKKKKNLKKEINQEDCVFLQPQANVRIENRIKQELNVILFKILLDVL